MRTLADVSAYGPLAGRVWVLETRLVRREQLERLVGAGTFEEVKRVIGETSYFYLGDFEVKEEGKVKEVIEKELASHFAELEGGSVPKEPFLFFRIFYEVQNLKSFLKGGDKFSPLGVISKEDWEAILNRKKTVEPFSKWAPSLTNLSFEEMERVLDKLYFEEKLNLAHKMESELLIGYVRREIDWANLKISQRGREKEIPSGKLKEMLIPRGNISFTFFLQFYLAEKESWEREISNRFGLHDFQFEHLDSLMEKDLMNYLAKSKYVSGGPESVVYYFYKKIREAEAVKISLVGVLTNWEKDFIRRELIAYV